LDAIPDMMFRMNRAGDYLDYHAPDPTRLLAPPERFMGRNVREVLSADRAGQCVTALEALVRTGESQAYEYEYRRRSGESGCGVEPRGGEAVRAHRGGGEREARDVHRAGG